MQAGAVPADEVGFRLCLGAAITWRKELVLAATDGEWTIAAQDGTRGAENGLFRYQLPEGRLRFRRAKFLGLVHDVHALANLDELPAGAKVTFSLTRD